MNRRKSYKIFDIDYLQNGELTEDDLYWLFETNSLTLSLIIEMFRFTKQDILDENTIVNIIKNNNDWMYKYFWTNKQRIDFEDILFNVYKNVRYCCDEEANSLTQFWIINYGLTNKELKRNKKISKICE